MPAAGTPHLVHLDGGRLLWLPQLVGAADQEEPEAVDWTPLHRVRGVLGVHCLQQPDATAGPVI